MEKNLNSQKRYIPSEEYRQMLVRDGERRFREWHSSFLKYQKAYLQEMCQRQNSSSARTN